MMEASTKLQKKPGTRPRKALLEFRTAQRLFLSLVLQPGGNLVERSQRPVVLSKTVSVRAIISNWKRFEQLGSDLF